VGHHLWPNQIRDMIRGKDVLDAGCGTSLYGAVFRALGARSYVGHDPYLNLQSVQFRNRLAPGQVKTPVSLQIVKDTIPNLDYIHTPSLEAVEQFDICIMHTVTEHLMDIEKSLSEMARALRPGGQIWYLHDNFYSWSGHHMQPRSAGKYTPGDPELDRYADWRHVDYEAPEGHPFRTNLNRIRLDDLRAVTEKFFVLDRWELVPEKKNVVVRLTPEIEARLSQYRREELLTKHAICFGRKR
jgi:SAM-dependent methyltransferase